MAWLRLSLIRLALILASWARRKIMRPAVVLMMVLMVAWPRLTTLTLVVLPLRFQRLPRMPPRLRFPQPHLRVLTLMFRRLRPILPLQRRPRMHPVRLPLLHPLTLTLPRLRALPLRLPPLPLTLPRLRFQHLHLLTLTRHRLRVLRLTLHPRLLVPITPRQVM